MGDLPDIRAVSKAGNRLITYLESVKRLKGSGNFSNVKIIVLIFACCVEVFSPSFIYRP